ncbi:MAG: polysulfide reductase NrfD [Syntrophorhabdaceae bacterium]|nr:polysulfide reductase NrfD [Syntrophorhabdaceae bacterium]
MEAWRFFKRTLVLVLKGRPAYYIWCFLLIAVFSIGLKFYFNQVNEGLIVTNMRDQVSWGLYIANFTYLVGVAAAAVLLVIPAYIYHFEPIKEIVVLGELFAASSMIMALMLVFMDLGRPERFWHLIPFIGKLAFPQSLLAWDVLVLNGYLFLNIFIPVYILVKSYYRQEPNKRFIIPLILFSIPMAVGIHTVTAFLYNGLPARPFWNASILAPRFLASAFCSGPAIIIIIFQAIRAISNIKIKDEALFKIAELIAYAMFLNLFLMGAEIFKEFYSDTIHLAPITYLYKGIGDHRALVPWIWSSFFLNVAAFLMFLLPATRRRIITLNIACLFTIVGIWIEKGIGFVLPGFTPDPLGEIYEYIPNLTEFAISLGIWALGLLIFTLFMKVAIPIVRGDFVHSRHEKKTLQPSLSKNAGIEGKGNLGE